MYVFICTGFRLRGLCKINALSPFLNAETRAHAHARACTGADLRSRLPELCDFIQVSLLADWLSAAQRFVFSVLQILPADSLSATFSSRPVLCASRGLGARLCPS